MSTRSMGRIFFALGVISASIVAYELLLMQILAIMQWYHFASMIISVALLGFGASGTILAFTYRWFEKHFDAVLPILLLAAGIAMPVSLWLSQVQCIRFDSYLVFAGQWHLWRLFVTYLIFCIPFVLGALAIGLCFVKLSRHIGLLYCANLLGSGAGAVIIVFLMWIMFPERLVSALSFACIFSGILVMQAKGVLKVAIAAGSGILPVMLLIHPPDLPLSGFKDIRRALDLPDARIFLKETSPWGLVQIVSSPAMRYAPGISLMYTGNVSPSQGVFINGDWIGPVASKENTEAMAHTTGAVAYAMKGREKVLVLDASTGADVFLALDMGARSITAVEPDSVIMKVLERSIGSSPASKRDPGRICFLNMNSRAYLAEDTGLYDLVILPAVGSFGGSSGLFALKEQYLLTREAFRMIWERLESEGSMSITCWMDYPARNPVRILSTLVEVLAAGGVDNPEEYVAAIRGWATMTFITKRSPINRDEQENIRRFCAQMLFDPVLLPDISDRERKRYNRLMDDSVFGVLDRIIAGGGKNVWKEYAFAVYPATDNRPYFSQFIRIKAMPDLAGAFGAGRVPFFELGYVLVLLTLVQVICASCILIVAPLSALGWHTPGKTGIIVYFGAIAFGYMFVEMVWIQRLMLYFSCPVYSASAVICVMLVFSGIGSYLSTIFHMNGKFLPGIILVIVLLIIITPPGLPFIIRTTTAMPGVLRVAAILFPLAPLAVFMGMPFPAGITVLARTEEKSVPWAWGINGCFSVISTLLATIVAVEAGFVCVMFCAACAYGCALGAWFFRLSPETGSWQ